MPCCIAVCRRLRRSAWMAGLSMGCILRCAGGLVELATDTLAAGRAADSDQGASVGQGRGGWIEQRIEFTVLLQHMPRSHLVREEVHQFAYGNAACGRGIAQLQRA